MRLRKAKHLTLALMVAAGLGVSASSAAAQQSSTQKKPSYTKPGTKSGAKSGTPTTKSGTSSHRGKISRTSSTSKRSNRRDKGQKAPTSDRITEIQQALAKNGAYSGTPNGKWDDSTVEAMKSFQTTHGLNPSGKLDAKTLQHLGLGSQTSGVAPPMPPTSSSSSIATPTQTAHRQQ
jgi:peptidoglycan hydrolase-like protein with peptidoglycan-binding domain